MNRLSDIISRIFSTDQTQGLSGGAEVVIDRDPASAFYASRLRRHRCDEDVVETPTWLWACVSYNQRKGGLRSHVAAERGDGVASFTDVLIVLNQTDARRAAAVEGEPWTERAARAISERFTNYSQKERFELLYGTRPLRFWFVADGGQDMLGHSFGLGPGEFITGLLPNLYVGPAPRSRPVLAIHLNLPGVWEGYREVGRLYSDQILYTLGRHWLDNFHHPSLREPGLYRLQQFPDGSLVHVISPELQDRYFVRSDALEGGASVLTIAERIGNPVAYLVLAVVETPAVVEPGMTVGVPLAAMLSTELDGGTPVEVSFEEDPDATTKLGGYADGSAFKRDTLQRTIIPDAIDARMLTLHERGALLQRVHFASFMEGYDVYVGPGGRIATQMPSPLATLQVRGSRVNLHVGGEGVRLDGRPASPGATLPLVGTVLLEVDGHTLEYRDLTDVQLDGWPYLGELRRPGAGTYLDFGGAFKVGRDWRCQVRLPDEPHNENIAWLPSVGTGTTIRSRTGDIPKSRFYTDSIMVASEHAELDLTGEPVLRSLARHCYTFVRRDGALLPLSPREGAGGGALELALRPNDEVLVGNCLFQVSYPPPAGQATQTVPPPAPTMSRPSAQELAALVDGDGTAPLGSSVPLPAPILPLPRFNTLDVAAAAGLGEAGPAPRPPGAPPPGFRDVSGFGAPTSAAPPPEPAPARAGALPSPPYIAPLPPPPTRALKSAASLPGIDEAPPPPLASRPLGDASTGASPGPTRLGMAGAAAPLPAADALVGEPVGRDAFARLADVGPAPHGAAASPPGAAPFAASAAPPREDVPTPLAAPASPTPPVDPTPPPPPMLLDEPSPEGELPLFAEVGGPDPVESVVSVEEARWKVELARPARLVQVGWMVSGEVVVGNHVGAQVIVPEVRTFKEQAFLTLDYFKLSVRGRKGRIELLQQGDAEIRVSGQAHASSDDLARAELKIVRRDANLEPDFDVSLRVRRDETLPDPRAQLVAIDTSDRLVAALFTVGFPLRADRRLAVGKLVATFRWDGARLQIDDYLGAYRIDGGFLPLFSRHGDRPWQTLPEDGARVELAAGDGLLVGNAVYRLVAG